MNLQMMGEVGVLSEGLLTFFTLTRFLTRVNSQMLDQRRIQSKGLPTLLTFKGLFTSVDALV